MPDNSEKKTERSYNPISKFINSVKSQKKERRDFLKSLLVLLGLGLSTSFMKLFGSGTGRYLRPPGAINGNEFLKKCMRCGKCGEVCPNQCINFFDLGSGENSETPYIIPREQGCILCMKCNHACPSGALQPIENDIRAIRENVRMGKAVLDKNLCFSYNNRVCGICYHACPLQDEALRIDLWEKPVIDMDKCVGCGLCERICYHYPQAIKIKPSEEI